MLLERRTLLLTAGAGLVLASCAGGPVILSVTAQGSAGMNPGPDGADRTVTVSVMQLAGTSAFDAADIFALQNPAAALGAEFIQADQLVIAPGGGTAKQITVQPSATAIGITAGFLDPTGKTVRQRISAPGASSALGITVGPSGLSVS